MTATRMGMGRGYIDETRLELIAQCKRNCRNQKAITPVGNRPTQCQRVKTKMFPAGISRFRKGLRLYGAHTYPQIEK